MTADLRPWHELPVEVIMMVLGVDEQKARFAQAISRGEIDGDVVLVGRPATPSNPPKRKGKRRG